MVPEILLQPWLREVGVVESRPMRTSRDVMSRRSNRPQHREVLYFPHRRLWTMEYSCKVWCKPCRRRLIPRQHSRPSWRPRCLKCGSSDHKIKDCPKLQQGAQREAPAPAVVEAAPATGRPGRPRAPARVFALARGDAEQAEHVTKGTVLLLGVHARVLFDTGATHSFISERFARQLALESGAESEELEVPLSVHTPAGT
ncbi:hypothetical protein Taro_034311, partial [Colocasia esculenta]|nr:hypothetical protein [Colocasia esculenta]